LLRSVSSTLLTAPAPPQLLHTDARSDNLRWKNGRLYLVDWAEAVAGPPELDAAFFIQSIAVESPLDPETILEWYRQIHPFDPEVMEAAIYAAAAFFADRAWLPELPGLPRLRTFQRRQLHVTLGWALRWLGLETPTWLAAVRGAADAR
jgi:Ser/Thr protein kinase RdoA (MazF antagonist)